MPLTRKRSRDLDGPPPSAAPAAPRAAPVATLVPVASLLGARAASTSTGRGAASRGGVHGGGARRLADEEKERQWRQEAREAQTVEAVAQSRESVRAAMRELAEL